MRVTLRIGPVSIIIEGPAGDQGRALISRLQAAMKAAGAVGLVYTQGPAIPERLVATPAAGITTEELGERVRAWCRRMGCEVKG